MPNMPNNLLEPKWHLRDLLLECPSIKDETICHLVVKELHFANTIPDNPRSDIHVLNIVNACYQHEDGFESLFIREL